jgi:hypothetical protein
VKSIELLSVRARPDPGSLGDYAELDELDEEGSDGT